MESFAFYLLKSAVWLTAFTLVYLLFLRKERFFRLKRVYLVAGVILSLLLPLITLHYRVEIPAPVISQVQAQGLSQAVQPATAAVQHEKTDFLMLFLFIYAVGIILFILRTLLHLVPLYRAVKVTAVDKMGDVKLIRSEKYTSAFSFFNYVFINPSVSEQEAREILNHEMVHLKQKHWFDLLLVELVGLVQWINPFAWIYSALVRQNHENLADEEALKCTSDPANYRAALLNQVFSTRMMSLSNSFNFSFYTNRFEMMKKRAFSPYRKFRLLLVVPLMALISYAFAIPRYAYAEPSPSSELAINQPEVITQKNVKGVVYREDGTPFMGVSVNLSGTTLTAITDADGRFEFKGIPENVILLFTYKGYEYLPLDPVFDKEMSVKMTPVPNYVDPATIKPDQSQKPMPIVVVDGVITDQNERAVMEKMRDDLGMLKSLTPKEAIEKYGEKGAAGATEFYSVKKARELGMNVPLRRKSQGDFPTFDGNSYPTFNDWVVKRTRYPEEAVSQGISGWAHVSYTIDTDGSVKDVKPTDATNTLLGNALAEVIRTSPRWEPPVNPGMNEPFTAEVVARFSLPDKVNIGQVFAVVEEMPNYPGGDLELLKNITKNITYPPEAKEQGVQGKVILRFVVTAEGKVEDISVVRGVHPLLDAEAIRVMSKVSDWIPGKQGGRPVDVYYSVPISFALK